MSKCDDKCKRFQQHVRVKLHFKEPPLTKQEFLEESDINNIVKKYQITGELPMRGRQGIFTDVSHVPDYREALDIVRHAQYGFEALPAAIRTKFNNDPEQMINFIKDPANFEESVSLGLLDKPVGNVVTAKEKSQPDLPNIKNEQNDVKKQS